MFDRFKESVLSLGQFTEHELSLIIERLVLIDIKKDAALLNKGETCRAVYFLNKGSFRQYITNDITEITQNLYTEADWMMDYESFTLQKPSQSSIEAAEDSEVFRLSVHDLHELLQGSGSFFRLGKLLGTIEGNKAFQNARMSPEEKYTLLLQTRPIVLQKFPLKHIASYLSLTPETISRVRKKIVTPAIS